MSERFCRGYAGSLSALLRTEVDTKLGNVYNLYYSEFIFGLDNPTCLNLLRAEPLEGNLILDISPSILYPMLDRLLGEGDKPRTMATLTEIEQRLVLRVTKMFLEGLQHAWENIIDLEFEIIQTESDPKLIQMIPSTEVEVVFSFEVTLLGACGVITLCIPYNAFKPFADKLASTKWRGRGNRNMWSGVVEEIDGKD